MSITQKELDRVRALWSGTLVMAHCDNIAMVVVVNSGNSNVNSTLAQLLRVLFSAKAQWQLEVLADALSRNNMRLFFSQAPAVSIEPVVVPMQVVELLD